MERVFALIQEHSNWIFGSSSLAAIVLIVVGQRRSVVTNNAETSTQRTDHGVKIALIFALIIAAAAGSISIGDIALTSNEITSGSRSDNLIINNSSGTVVTQ